MRHNYMKTKKLLFLVMTFFSFTIQNAFALGSMGHMSIQPGPQRTKAQIESAVKQVITDSSGDTFRVGLIQYKNFNG